jgi:hypothetical protein
MPECPDRGGAVPEDLHALELRVASTTSESTADFPRKQLPRGWSAVDGALVDDD